MKFDDLDRRMRSFERSIDQRIPEGLFLVARLDGRNFTRLTKETCPDLAHPFDTRFNEAMVETVKRLMRCGFEAVYGYTESDEISLLFAYGASTFERKVRKYVSILAGEASAHFTKVFGETGVFDCRMVPLPDMDSVADYFRWRQEDSHRNSLNAYLYWTMRDAGKTAREADRMLLSISNDRKREILSEYGIDYEGTPAWQRWGVGVYNEKAERKGYNPVTGKEETGTCNVLKVDRELPLGDDYAALIERLVRPSYDRERLRVERAAMESAEAKPPGDLVDEGRRELEALHRMTDVFLDTGRKISERLAWNVVKTLNRTMKGEVDETLSYRGLNFFDMMSIKHRTLPYSQFFFGFQEELDRLIDEQIGSLSETDALVLMYRNPLMLETDGKDEVLRRLHAEVLKAFGEILDAHYGTVRMRRFLERYPWLEQ